MIAYEVIIIGGGPAGIAAAIPLLREKRKVLVLEMRFLGGKLLDISELTNYPGFARISGFDLGGHFTEHFNSLGGEVRHEKVLSIKKTTDFIVETTQGVFRAPYVILATGTSYRTLDLPNEKALIGKGISFCGACDGPLYRNQVIAVVGGSLSAVNEALHLAREVKTLYFIHRSKETLRINETYQKLAALPNVIFYLPYEITKINGQDQLASLEILNKETGKVETLVCNALFEFIGATPNNEMLNQLEVKKDPAGYLMVDENLMSSVKNLYVIGDLKSYPVRQIALAVGDGIKVATVINEALARER